MQGDAAHIPSVVLHGSLPFGDPFVWDAPIRHRTVWPIGHSGMTYYGSTREFEVGWVQFGPSVGISRRSAWHHLEIALRDLLMNEEMLSDEFGVKLSV